MTLGTMDGECFSVLVNVAQFCLPTAEGTWHQFTRHPYLPHNECRSLHHRCLQGKTRTIRCLCSIYIHGSQSFSRPILLHISFIHSPVPYLDSALFRIFIMSSATAIRTGNDPRRISRFKKFGLPSAERTRFRIGHRTTPRTPFWTYTHLNQ